MLAGRLTGTGDYSESNYDSIHPLILYGRLTELDGGRVGFFLEGGRAVAPFGGVVTSLPVNLFKLSNKSDGMKSFGTPFVVASASFFVPSMNGSRQPFPAGCTALTVPAAGTMLSVPVDIVIYS